MVAIQQRFTAPISRLAGLRETVRHENDTGLPVIVPLIALTILGWGSLAMSPWLMRWPLVLIALNPRMVFLLLVAPKVGFTEFTIIATARLCLADPFSYMLGFRYGGKIRDKLEASRIRRLILRVTPVERTACGIAIWLRPSQSVLAWAGSLHMSKVFVAISDVITTALYVIAIYEGLSLLR